MHLGGVYEKAESDPKARRRGVQYSCVFRSRQKTDVF